MDHTLPTTTRTASRTGSPEDPRLAQTEVGTWWRVLLADDPLAQGVDPVPVHGVILPIVAVHRIDGAIHSVDLHRHPRAGKGTVRLLVEDLWARCTPTLEGTIARAAEQNDLLAAMGDAQKRLAAGPSNDEITRMIARTDTTEAAHAHTPLPPADNWGQLPAALTGGRDSGVVARHAANTVAQASARAQWAAEVAQDLGAMGALLGRFQQEQVAVVQAQADASAHGARAALERLDTLTLFLGERQEVTTLVEGRSAPPQEPLHFFQQMLYLDEELAVAWPDPEGFTWKTGFDSLGTLLSEHPSIVARMLPQPRSVAIARIRRRSRPLPDAPKDWVDAFRTIAEQEWDKALLILVRDGERVHMIEADQDTAGAERLFPSRAEIDALYREKGWGRAEDITITPEDLAYVESRAAHAQRALFYKRFLVLFWGLHARLGLFGPFMPTDANWFDPRVQETYFRFVHDEEMGLEAPGDRVIAWMTSGVEKAGPGTRVAVDTRAALDSGILVDGYADIDRRRLKGRARDRFLVATVESDGQDLHITVPMEEGRKTVRRQLRLTHEGRPCTPRGMVVLDDLTLATIDARLDSRRDRVDYIDYVPLLRWLRPAVMQEEKMLAHTLGITPDVLETEGWKAARRALKGTRPARLPALAKAYTNGIAQARNSAPALIDPKGHAHRLTPWAHPTFVGFPNGLWSAGGVVCAPHHPAPNGWVHVGDLDRTQGQGLGPSYHRVDLPTWLDTIAQPQGHPAMGDVLEGKEPEAAMAFLKRFVAHNKAQKGTRVLPALCTWTLGVGFWQETGRDARLLTVCAQHDPAALAVAACGEAPVRALFERFYRDPDMALERARERAQNGWSLSIGRASPTQQVYPALDLDWEEAWAGHTVQRQAIDGAPQGSDGGMLWGGAVEHPSGFLFGGPSKAAYEDRARSARFWVRESARAWLAPLFGAGRWSQEGIIWFPG